MISQLTTIKENLRAAIQQRAAGRHGEPRYA